MMNKKIIRFVLATLCYSVAIAAVFYFLGRKMAYHRMENSTQTLNSQTFYATISDIRDDGTFTVTGMEINDINFRGEFSFSVVENTKITWRYTDILLEDLEVGDHISITFIGDILESSPKQIQQVEVIQLLDDEK
ncbi:MAG: DUF3221 domain-containing protein [Lachnospiraceae bacterium]|jgi:hypothetical protein|nr:DUF3221 domain-containing protein [Lachnospiraceae bacterium]